MAGIVGSATTPIFCYHSGRYNAGKVAGYEEQILSSYGNAQLHFRKSVILLR